MKTAQTAQNRALDLFPLVLDDEDLPLMPVCMSDPRALDDAGFLSDTLAGYDVCMLEIECITLNA